MARGLRWLQSATWLFMPVLFSGCHGCSSEAAPAGGTLASAASAQLSAPALGVPRATEKIVPNGEVDEVAWTSAGRAGPFTDRSGSLARPSSEARILWDATNLYLVLYAADESIHADVKQHDGAVWLDDAFSIVLQPAGDRGAFAIDVSASGVTTDVRRSAEGKIDPTWESGITVGIDRDGTLNDPSDDDEEWIVEAAIPWARLGITPAPGVRIGLSLKRCDTPRGAPRSCGAWGEERGGLPSGVIELR